MDRWSKPAASILVLGLSGCNGMLNEAGGSGWGEVSEASGSSESSTLLLDIASPEGQDVDFSWRDVEFDEVVCGSEHSCAISHYGRGGRGGAVYCWGANESGQAEPPPNLSFSVNGVVKLRLGQSHSCAITAKGEGVCWGDGPMPPDGLLYLELLPGVDRTCARYIHPLDREHQVHGVCWETSGEKEELPVRGTGADGILPHGPTLERNLGGVLNWLCLLDSDKQGRCQDFESGEDYSPPPGTYEEIGAGDRRACVNEGGQVWCWRAPGEEQGSVDDFAPPPHEQLHSLTVGARHACALTPEGEYRCWGDDAAGQVSRLDKGQRYRSICAGRLHTCGVTLSGEIRCAGSDGRSQSFLDTSPVPNRPSAALEGRAGRRPGSQPRPESSG